MGELAHRLWLRLATEDLRTLRVELRRLETNNRFSAASIIAPHGPVVSLTTFGTRIDSVYLSIESIARGSLLPSRLILWMNEEDRCISRPTSLQRLEARGLEVRFTSNYGPHKKYFSYIGDTASFNQPLATADDDAIYPANWLKGLADVNRANPSLVSCYRAHVVAFVGENLAPYTDWHWCRSTKPSFLNFATGVSGTIYPPALLERLKAAGAGFEQLCPRADDVWLHVHALRGGFRIKQVKPWAQSFPSIPGTQDNALFLDNVHSSQNDLQIRQTYTADDLKLLRAHFRASNHTI